MNNPVGRFGGEKGMLGGLAEGHFLGEKATAVVVEKDYGVVDEVNG